VSAIDVCVSHGLPPWSSQGFFVFACCFVCTAHLTVFSEEAANMRNVSIILKQGLIMMAVRALLLMSQLVALMLLEL